VVRGPQFGKHCLITFNLMQYFTSRVLNMSNISRSIMKLIEVFPLFVEQMAVFSA
jgi:hypothetical protein